LAAKGGLMRASWLRLSLGLVVSGWLFSACAATEEAPEEVPVAPVAAAEERPQPPIGSPLPRLTAAPLQPFNDGQAEFQTAEDPDEGLGPVFNDVSCVACHGQAATGGGSARVETRFGRLVNGVFDPMAAFGGSLINERAVPPSGSCSISGEIVPAEATIR